MPITPFHFGPAALTHAIAPKRVSFLAFCAANVLVDMEPLYYMLQGEYPLHRFFHTYVGVTLVVLLTIALFELALRVGNFKWLPNIFGWKNLNHFPVMLGAILGGYSHILLDSFMHEDIRPLAPLTMDNGLLGLISVDNLHLLCALAGVLGIFILLLRDALQNRNDP